MEYVLVGRAQVTKVFGPFPDEDAARKACDLLGMPDLGWEVVPLIPA